MDSESASHMQTTKILLTDKKEWDHKLCGKAIKYVNEHFWFMWIDLSKANIKQEDELEWNIKS